MDEEPSDKNLFQIERIYPLRRKPTAANLTQDALVLLRSAKSMGVCSALDTPESLVEESKKLTWYNANEFELAKVFARDLIKNIFKTIHRLTWAEEYTRRTGNPAAIEHPDGSRIVFVPAELKGAASAEIAHLAGYLSAISDIQDERTRLAAAKRREDGKRSRDRLRAAADEVRGRMTREAAADELSEKLGKSPSTLRRLLSKEFPGESWSSESIVPAEKAKSKDDLKPGIVMMGR